MPANANEIKWEAEYCTPNTGQLWATDPNPTQMCAPGVVCVPSPELRPAPEWIRP